MTMNDIDLTFSGGKHVEATVRKHHIVTDQTLAHGGDDSAPEPFELFLASLATCAGLYVLGFCQRRGIPTDSITLVQHHEPDLYGQLIHVELELRLPRAFPDKYRTAVVRAAEGCKVRKTLASPPEVTVRAVAVPGHDDSEEPAIA